MAEIKKIQFKRGLKAVLEAKLTSTQLGVLAAGEPAYEMDTGQVKIGDGVSNYTALPYVGGGSEDERFAIHDPLSDQVLLYDSTLGKWVNKNLADNNSIIYLAQHGLTIKGYENATQGQMLVKDSTNGLTWINPVSDTTIQNAVAAAESSMNQAGAYAVQAGNKAIEAATSANQASRINQQTMNFVNNKFWWGSLAEYNELDHISADTFYFIRMEE